jgi:hypothetical protein
MSEAVHAIPLQMQGLVFAVEPSMEEHSALAEKQMHLELLLQAVVDVGCELNLSVTPPPIKLFDKTQPR